MNKKYKVISYNIHSGKNIYMIPQLKKIVNFLNSEQPDIIGIQEIHENNKKGNQVSYLAAKLNYNVNFSPNVLIGTGYYGVATFSHFNIKGEHILLPSTGEQRGLLDSLISLENNKKIHLLNTHLSLKYIEREKQIAEIKSYIKNLRQPFILLGDFNTDQTKIENIIDSAKLMNKEHLSTLMLFNKRIDYMYLSNDLNLIDYNIKYEKMSDHYPIIIEFTLH